MIRIDGYIINKSNITYIKNMITKTESHIYKEKYHLMINFVSGKEITFETYDEDEFHYWINLFKKELEND